MIIAASTDMPVGVATRIFSRSCSDSSSQVAIGLRRPPRLSKKWPHHREFWHDLCGQISTGGLQCPDLTQRCQHYSALAVLCIWGVKRNGPQPRGRILGPLGYAP